MQSLQWTTDLIILASVASLVLVALGCLLTMVLMGRRNTRLNGKLDR